MKWFIALIAFGLAGCADWPDTAHAAQSRGQAPWPELLPLSEIILADPNKAAAEDDAARLLARAAALRSRAALLRQNIEGQAEMDALRRRLAR